MSMNAERALTPVLLDLMEHEKVIEQGLATFIDVGNALVAIRDGRKYRAVGHATFEAYCAERWGFSDRHARRVMEAADTAALLEQTGPMGPISERQVRHLAVLRDEPELMREAWAEAIDDADGGQPTGAQADGLFDRIETLWFSLADFPDIEEADS